MQRDHLFQFIGKLGAIYRFAARIGIARQIVRVADMIDRQGIAKRFAVAGMPPTEIPPKPTP